MKETDKRNQSKRSTSPLIKSIFSSENEINNLRFEDILDFNFLQNFLQLIDKDEFFIDNNMKNENLINHITYMLKQYLRKRNFDPSHLVDGLKEQLLEENNNEKLRIAGNIKNINLALHSGFGENDQSNQKSFMKFQGTSYKIIQSQFVFEEPKWILVKLIFLVAFLNKDK